MNGGGAKDLGDRAARLWASLTQHVNLRTAAEVLAWLAGVVAFALVFPLWLTLAVGSISIGAGVIRAAESRIRAALIALPIVIVVVLAAFLIARPSTSQTSPSAVHQQHKWVSVGYGIQAALEAKNLTYRPRWGTVVGVEGWDRLQFRLLVRNTNTSRSPPLVAREYVNQRDEPGGEPRFITFSFGLGETGTFAPGPRVNLVAESNAVSRFWGTPLHYGEPTERSLSGDPSFTTPAVEALSVPLPRSPPAEQGTGEEYEINSIAPRGQVEMGFTGSFLVPRSAQLSDGGGIEIENPDGPDNRYASTTSAIPGETLSASALLANTGFRGVDVRARVRFGSQDHGIVSRLTLYVSEDDAPFFRLRVGTVNSGDGAPLLLAVQPGSTEVEDAKNACTAKKEPLPDGISEGGVDVGNIGGWLPRDPCHGSEFARFLNFKLTVAAGGEARVNRLQRQRR
jgi:hypothetical protein